MTSLIRFSQTLPHTRNPTGPSLISSDLSGRMTPISRSSSGPRISITVPGHFSKCSSWERKNSARQERYKADFLSYSGFQQMEHTSSSEKNSYFPPLKILIESINQIFQNTFFPVCRTIEIHRNRGLPF